MKPASDRLELDELINGEREELRRVLRSDDSESETLRQLLLVEMAHSSSFWIDFALDRSKVAEEFEADRERLREILVGRVDVPPHLAPSGPPFPLGLMVALRKYAPRARVLEVFYQLEPETLNSVTTLEERKVLVQLARRGRLMRKRMEQAQASVEQEGFVVKEDGTVCLPSQGGAPQKWLNRIIEQLYDYLAGLGEAPVYGGDADIKRAVQRLLSNFVEVDFTRVHDTVQNHLTPRTSRRSDSTA